MIKYARRPCLHVGLDVRAEPAQGGPGLQTCHQRHQRHQLYGRTVVVHLDLCVHMCHEMRRAVRTCIHMRACASCVHVGHTTKFPSNGQNANTMMPRSRFINVCCIPLPSPPFSENQFDSCTVPFFHAGRTGPSLVLYRKIKIRTRSRTSEEYAAQETLASLSHRFTLFTHYRLLQ